MKRILLLFISLIVLSSLVNSQEKLFISEVADPANIANAKFVELYNSGATPIDFDTQVYYLSRQANGGSWGNIKLTGTIGANSAYVLANNSGDFGTAYPGITANIYSTTISGNGDDGYFIYKGGDNSSGTLIDAYGVINQDGTGFPWEYTDSRAERKSTIILPNGTWTASEWIITTSANTSIFTPGSHTVAGGPNTNLSELLVSGTLISGFASGTLAYTYDLPSGTSVVPIVTATAEDAGSSVLITPATNLSGDKTSRTTTVLVTASDGITTKTYSVLFNPLMQVSSLASLRSQTELDRKYKVLGEVVLTAKMSYRNKKYLQDGTAGILIDDNAGIVTTSYDVGDGITGITGTLELYNGMLQWHPTADPGPRTSENNAIVPQVVTVNELKTNLEMYESEVVKIMDIGFRAADAGVNFTNGKNYTVGNTGDSTILRTDFYDIFTGTVVPVAANVTGIALEFNGTAQIAPRVVSDIAGVGSAIDSRELQKLRIYPVPASTSVTLEGIESFSSVEIMDITGKRVVNLVNDGNPMQTISVETLPRGIYFVKFNSAAGSVTRKIVKK